MSKKVRAKAGNVKGSRPDFIQLQELALRKKTLFCLCAVTAALGAGCGNDADKDNVVYLTNKPHAIVERSFDMNSKVGCALDSDCSDGMFCFHGLCTNECDEKNPCAVGVCSVKGRCIEGKKSPASSPEGPGTSDGAGAPEGPDTAEVARTLADDLEEARQSDVVDQIPGAEVLDTPADRVYVDPGASVVVTTVVVADNYGPVSYTVSDPEDDTVSNLMQSEPVVDEVTGTAVYTFEIPVEESSLGEQGEVERVILDTSVGAFEVALAPRKRATGLYEGMVSANQFAGVGLPIRFIVETKPADISSFSDIEGLTLYLPSSGADLFSPEIITDASKTTWSKIEMKKDGAANCMEADECWSANYSTNDYTFPESLLLSADQKVNRAIRIEIAGYDASSMMFDGSMRDIMAGVYREVDGTGKRQWAKATMEGVFTATRKGGFDKADYTIVDHNKQSESLRDLNAVAADVCSDADVKALMALADESCKDIATLAGFNAAENSRACLLGASSALLASEELVSKIIEALITKDPKDLDPVQGFATLQDFMDDCAKDNGICAERHEIVCAVDLLGRSYLTSDESNKLETLKSWHQLMRESYLGRQYSAWQNDVEVRRKWLENSDSPTFLTSILEKINTDMLATWETKVFDAHRNVLAKQFSQTSLEVLTRVDKNSEIVSDRDMILAEFADGWSGVSDSMALGLRRYDALYQGTTQRKGKAAEMRPRLFDLYYSGLVETAINRATGNGSLNGSYGKNLYENVARLRSLDQSFDDLVFMRDAEVVTNTSLDPESNNLKVLSDRKKLAKETVAAAQARRDKVFDDYDKKTIDKAQINATLTDTIESLQTELVALCGLPRGCDDAKSANCAPRVEIGFCGFDLPADSLVPADLERNIDMTMVSRAEIDKYYSTKSYEIDADKLKILSESDIRAMDDAKRNTLLGIKDSDLQGKDEAAQKSFVDSKIAVYLATQKAQLNSMVSDYYSITNSGEAAEAILAYRAALKDVDIAQADFTAHYNKVAIARATCESYAANIERWNNDRVALLENIQKNIEAIHQHEDNISDAEYQKTNEELKQLSASYQRQIAYVQEWNSLTSTYNDGQKAKIGSILAMNIASMVGEYASGVAERFTEATTAIFEEPTQADELTGFSLFGGMKSATTFVGNAVVDVIEGANLALNITQASLETSMQIDEINYNYNVELAGLTNDLDQQKLELDLQTSLARYQRMGDEASCKKNGGEDCHSVVTCDCSGASEDLGNIYSEVSCPTEKGCQLITEWYVMGLDRWIDSEQGAIDTLEEINDNLRELAEIKDVYERDVQDLDFKRSEYMQMSQDLLVKRQQILKAQLQAYSALKHYYSVAQRAKMLQSQYSAASDRLAVINNLYSTPAAIFSFASDLEVVESKIELAKERIYDYLAAIEYLAVRPFVDLRRATYLARSTNDLDKIIDQLDTVVSSCGGGTPNVATVEISAREMMGITQDFANMTMGERFRSVIAKGNIPVNSLTRYTVEENVRNLMKKGSDLRSGTFAVSIDKSMNLATTCNAKIDSIAVQIVGENIIKEGAGANVHPTITVFYDGQTQLVSCQPNIEPLVATIGSKTSYGKYSTFVVEPTKISPVAGINEYGSVNISLAGKPFATSYTVLIDTEVSENSKIDWDKVDDIKLEVKYTYQDLFPNSSACVSL